MAGFLFPFAYVPDPDKGKPIALGEMFFGEADKDPESFPIQVYAKQEDGTEVPISLGGAIELSAGGVPVYDGSPVQLVTDVSPYSLRVKDKNGAQKYFAEFVSGIAPVEAFEDYNIATYDNLADALAADGDLGDFVETAEYNAGTGVGGSKYKIVSASPAYLGTINHAKTDGSGYYLQLLIDGELWIEDAGAYDGKADSTDNIQDCINYQSNNDGVTVRAGQGTFNFSNLYTYYDAADNPNFNSDPDEEGQIAFVGSGRCSRVLYPSNLRGTTLNCTSSSGVGIALGKDGEFSRGTILRDMNIIGDINGKLVTQISCPLFSLLENLLIVNADETSTSVALYITRCWISIWRNIEVYGVTDTNAGMGLWYDVVDGSTYGGVGGMNLFENINCDRFASGAIFGRAYDAGQLNDSDFSDNIVITNMQCRRGTEGLTIRHGIKGIWVNDFWGEQNDTCHIRLRDSAENINIYGGFFAFADEGLICEGISGGTTVQNTVLGVSVESPNFGFLDNAGYRRYGTDDSGLTELRKVQANNNGGYVVVADDRYQRINVEITEWSGTSGRTLVDDSLAFAPYLYNHGDVNAITTRLNSGATLDMSAWKSVPAYIEAETTSSDVDIVLPTSSGSGNYSDRVCWGNQITFFKESANNNVNITGGVTSTLSSANDTETYKGTINGWNQII